jgi:hypothetical protein
MPMLKLLSLIFLFSIHFFCFSQTTITIKFDFVTKTISNPTELSKIKNGDYVSIEICNFNPYLYQAQIAFTDSAIPVNTVPTLFSSFFNTTDLTTLVANLSSTALKIFPGAPPPAAAGPAPRTRRDSISTMAHIIQTHKVTVIRRQTEIGDLIQKIQVFTFDQNIKLLVVKKWHLKASDITDFTNNDQTTYYTSVIGFFNDRNTIRGNILTDIGSYESSALFYGKYIKEDPTLRAADSLTRISNRELMQSIGSFDTTFTFSKFESILAQLINLNKENFKYTSLPTQITSDIKKIDLSILPWNTSSNLSSYKASWQFPAIQKSYFSFSTDFYFSGLHNENYFAEQHINAPGDTSYSISRENTGKVEMGITAFLHYGWYFKNKSNTSFHFTFGPGLSIQKNPQPRLLAGIGAGIGRKNKILISTGLIVGEVQRLRNYYQTNPTVKFSPTDLTTNVLRTNIFISVGYSIL